MIGPSLRQIHSVFARTAVGFSMAALLVGEVQAGAWAAPASQAPINATSAEIRQFAFSPSPLVISAGASVTWTNRDAIEHTVTSGSPDAPGSAFDSGFLNQEQAFSYRFDEPGEYPYFCLRHPFMQGTLEVSQPAM
jgi:plastocyanin